MGLFSWKSLGSAKNKNNNHNNNHYVSELKVQSYDKTVASVPPIKGSYPVAGNGPSLEQIQHARLRRISTASPAPAPNIPLPRDRPQTAPHDGSSSGGYTSARHGHGGTGGRTLSGFSMKAPPFLVIKRHSTSSLQPSRSRQQPYLPRAESPPPLPSLARIIEPTTPIEPIKAYQLATGKPQKEGLGGNYTASRRTPVISPTRDNTSTAPLQPLPSPPPVRQEQFRNGSQASYKPYVDVLDVHAALNSSQETLTQRRRAMGLRIYGEDVADRNIKDFGDPQLNFTGPEFAYLKHVYSHLGRPMLEPGPRADSALGHIFGSDRGSDDIQPQSQSPSNTSSVRSFNGARPSVAYPPRTGPAASNQTSRRGDILSDARQKPLSPLSSSISVSSIDEEFQIRYHRSDFAQRRATPPIIEPEDRGRPKSILSKPPVSFPSHLVPSSQNGQPSHSILKTRSRTMSVESINSASASASARNGGSSSQRSSVSFSGITEILAPHSATPIQNSSAKRRENTAAQGGSDEVYLKDYVDIDSVTSTAPAVVREHVTPVQHELVKEEITRQVHYHDVSHRVLPIIDTEILPAKHYIKSEDGKTLFEIPKSAVGEHYVTHRKGFEDLGEEGFASPDMIDDHSAVDLARAETKSSDPTAQPRSSRPVSNSSFTKIFPEPFLSSKQQSAAKEYLRIDLDLRNQPVSTIADNKSTPSLASDAFSGKYRSTSSDEADESVSTDGEYLFQDSGYGGGMLPGLDEPSPTRFVTNEPKMGQKGNDERGQGKLGDAVSTIPRSYEGNWRGLKRVTEKITTAEDSIAGKEWERDGLDRGITAFKLK